MTTQSRGLVTRRHLLKLAIIASVGRSVAARASESAVLTVTGRIDGSPDPAVRRFSVADLERLGTTEFTTHTPWYSEACRFSGPRLGDVIAASGTMGETLLVTALNDYAARIPVDSLKTDEPILATRRDGQLMPVHDKGPLFVIYPFDSRSDLRHQMFYCRSVWQVHRIDVL